MNIVYELIMKLPNNKIKLVCDISSFKLHLIISIEFMVLDIF